MTSKKTSEKRLEEKVRHELDTSVDRRTFLKRFIQGAVLLASASLPVKGESFSWKDFFQKHYKELTAEDKKRIFARIEEETKKRHDVSVTIKDPPPLEGVEYAYCLNLSKCIGCRRCVYACAKENNTSRDPEIQYIKVLEMPKGSLDVEEGNIYYDAKEVPREGKFYMPVQCHQCANPPCVKVCPVEATWQEKDGIVVIDYDWCIGCRYCEAACPYEARRFNFATPSIASAEINPDQSYLSNRIRPRGVMEKCTFCLHRVRKGLYPACLEACPTGSRKFGNMLDPKSEVRRIIEEKRVFVLKEELKTHPRFYYFFD